MPSVLNRTLAAILGGYLFASAGAVLLAALGERPGVAASDAMLGGALLGLALYAPAIVWAFAARSTLHAWSGLLGASLLLAIVACVLAVVPRGLS